MPARMASIAELSLGPPQGSLGIILEEGSADAGPDADEGQSAPRAAAKAASNASKHGAATKGRKRCALLSLQRSAALENVCSLLLGGH